MQILNLASVLYPFCVLRARSFVMAIVRAIQLSVYAFARGDREHSSLLQQRTFGQKIEVIGELNASGAIAETD